jgi:hypothetical protein
MVYNNVEVIFAPLRIPVGGKKECGWIAEGSDVIGENLHEDFLLLIHETLLLLSYAGPP